MPNQKLVDYVKSQLDAGVASDELRQNLSESSWSDSDIEDAMASSTGKPEDKVAPPKPRLRRREVITIFDSFKKAFQILVLDKDVMQEIAESDTTLNAIIILLIAGLLLAVASPKDQLPELIQTNELALIIILPVLTILFSFIGYGVMHAIARLFGGKASFIEFYRAAAHTNVVYWIVGLTQLVPLLGTIIGGLASLWLIVVNVSIFKAVHKLSTGRAIVVVFIPYFLLFLAALIIALFFVRILFTSLPI